MIFWFSSYLGESCILMIKNGRGNQPGYTPIVPSELLNCNSCLSLLTLVELSTILILITTIGAYPLVSPFQQDLLTIPASDCHTSYLCIMVSEYHSIVVCAHHRTCISGDKRRKWYNYLLTISTPVYRTYTVLQLFSFFLLTYHLFDANPMQFDCYPHHLTFAAVWLVRWSSFH